MDYLADFFAKHRRLLAGLVAAATIMSALGLARLQIDSDPRAMLNAEDLQAGPLRELEEHFGASDSDCVIVLQADDFVTPMGVRVVGELVSRARQVDGAQRVTSMLSVRGRRRVGRYVLPLLPASEDASSTAFEDARVAADGHPLLSGRLLSADRSTTLVIVRLAGSGHSEARIRQFVQDLEEIASDVTADTSVEAALTGLPVLRLEMISALMRDQLKFNLTAMCAGGAVCLLMFRSVSSTVVVMLASMTGVFWTMGAMGWMGVPINMITSVIAPLVLVLGVSDAIHLHLEIRRAADSGSAPLAAAQAGIRNVGLACALTSMTTFAGFGSLRLASLDVIRVFGTWAALGCALNYIAVIVMVPLLSARFPTGATAGGSPLMTQVSMRLTPLLWAITRWRRTVVVASVVLTIALFRLGLTLPAENKLTETIPTTERAYQALQTCDDQFGGAMVASVILQWPADQAGKLVSVLEEVHRAIDHQPHVFHPTSLLNLLDSLPGAAGDPRQGLRELRHLPDDIVLQFVNAGEQRAVVDARIPDVGSSVLSPEFEVLEQEFRKITARYPGFSIDLTGGSVLSFRNLRLIVQDLWRSLCAAAIVIIITLTLAFRSVSLGAISVIPNMFPLVCASAALVVLGRPLEVSSVVVFSMCLGIATDDTIHFLARYQRERMSGIAPAEAVRQSISVVGEAIIVTTVLLTIGFGSFLFSGIPALQSVGQLACVALLTALVGDLVILPSLLLLAYDRPHAAASSPPAPERGLT